VSGWDEDIIVAHYNQLVVVCNVMSLLPVTELPALALRVGAAWRELRRGGSTQAMRVRLYADLPGGLELGQVDTLDLLVSEGEVRMRSLADALRVDRSTATRAVDRLVAAGLAERTTAAGDGRGVVVRATREGVTLHAKLMDRRRAFLLDVLAAFDEDEQAQLADLLERLVTRSDALLEGA
jgi:DNA-binding MarR family transcriptional regulator